MTRDEFMRELEYLLQDVPDEDKEDALQYYRDYLDEAGPDREEAVVSEFGSPERVAAMIRSDIEGSLADGGEFTERGYQDERFRDPNYQMAKRYDLPEAKEGCWGKGQEGKKTRTSLPLKIILWIILILVAVPVILWAGGWVAGIVVAAVSIVVACLLVSGIVTLVLLVVGVALLVVGMASLVVQPADGLLIIGVAIAMIGGGALALALSFLVYGRLVPFLARGVVDLFSCLFHKRRVKS